MSRDMLGGAILAAGVWAIFAAGHLGLASAPPRGHAWTVTGSGMIRSHPELVRIAPPARVLSTGNATGEKLRLPEG